MTCHKTHQQTTPLGNTSPFGATLYPIGILYYVAAIFWWGTRRSKAKLSALPGCDPQPPSPKNYHHVCRYRARARDGERTRAVNHRLIFFPLSPTINRKAPLWKGVIIQIQAGEEQPPLRQGSVCHRASRLCQGREEWRRGDNDRGCLQGGRWRRHWRGWRALTAATGEKEYGTVKGMRWE